MTDDQIKHMVNRFLGWKLPDNFNPDAGIAFERSYPIHGGQFGIHEPTGTNLFDYTQAEAMVRYMLEGMPAALSSTDSQSVGDDATCDECGFPISECNAVTNQRSVYESGLLDAGMAPMAARDRAYATYPPLVEGDQRIRPIVQPRPSLSASPAVQSEPSGDDVERIEDNVKISRDLLSQEVSKIKREKILNGEATEVNSFDALRAIRNALSAMSSREAGLRDLLSEILSAQMVQPYRGWNITKLNKAVDKARAFMGLPSIRELNPDIAKMQDSAAANRKAIQSAVSGMSREDAATVAAALNAGGDRG